MLRALRVVTLQSFMLLRRDRLVWPVLVVATLITAFASISSSWSVGDSAKILFDVGFSGFLFLGTLVALIWGTKAATESRQDGALEVQLAAPVGRSVFLLGRYLGICMGLAMIAVLTLAIWQLAMWRNRFGVMTPPQFAAFGLLSLSWLVVAALSVFFSTCARPGVALFASICTWISGLVAAPLNDTLLHDGSYGTNAVIRAFARFWDFQQFNAIDRASSTNLMPLPDLCDRFLYGGLLIIVLMSLSCIAFSRPGLRA